MSNLDYTYKLNENISVGVNGDIFEQSFGNREETEDILDLIDIANNKARKVIGINGTEHSSKVVVIDAKNIDSKTRLLKKGIDGIIITNLNQYKDKISLILGIADCAPIAFSSDDGNTIGLVHAGWSGTSKDIIGNITKKLKQVENKEKYETLENYNFYIGPMAGNKFEFDENLYFEKFQKLCDKYRLHSGKYFLPTKNGKGFLDLRGLIFDVFLASGIDNRNIVFSDIKTNSSKNPWPSYRGHTLYKKIKDKLGHTSNMPFEIKTGGNIDPYKEFKKYGLSDLEIDFFLGEYFDENKKDNRISMFVEN